MIIDYEETPSLEEKPAGYFSLTEFSEFLSRSVRGISNLNSSPIAEQAAIGIYILQTLQQ